MSWLREFASRFSALFRKLDLSPRRSNVALISVPKGNVDARAGKALRSGRLGWVLAYMLSVVLLSGAQLKVRNRFALRIFQACLCHRSFLLGALHRWTVSNDGIHHLFGIQVWCLLKLTLQWTNRQIGFAC